MGSLYKGLKRIVWIVLLLAFAVSTPMPAAQAQETGNKVVRVGWYESTFCYRDKFGRRRGLDYEYQHKIAAYTGWTYEYVEDSWSNLLQKLKVGEIDLLSDVSFTAERANSMFYPDLPMGSEAYYIFIDANNKAISADNLSSFNGKKIGVNQGSVQEGFLREWAQKHNLAIEIVPLTTEEAESASMKKSENNCLRFDAKMILLTHKISLPTKRRRERWATRPGFVRRWRKSKGERVL